VAVTRGARVGSLRFAKSSLAYMQGRSDSGGENRRRATSCGLQLERTATSPPWLPADDRCVDRGGCTARRRRVRAPRRYEELATLGLPVPGEAVAVQVTPFPRGERAADARIIQRAKRAYFSFQTRSLTERRNICSRMVRGVSARS
jgi:hypothetical protein